MEMKKLAVVVLVGVFGGSLCLAGGPTTAQQVLDSTSSVGFDANLFFRNSIHYDTTFWNYENEYDYFYQPQELTDIQFDRNGRLGNNHDGPGEDYKSMYWGQFSNNGVADTGNLDALTAAGLFHLGPGMFGVSAAIAGHENSSSVGTTPTFDLDQSLAELYLTYGMQATDTVSWGVAIDWFSEDTDSGVGAGAVEDEGNMLTLKGAVKFKTSDDFWWSARAHFGQPEFESSGSTFAEELDGDSIGVGADLNWVFDAWDAEINADFSTNDFDATSVSGPTILYNGDATTDVWRIQGRAFHKLGPAEVWKSLMFWNVESDADLLTTGSIVNSATEDVFVIAPSAAVRFPFGCRECDIMFAGIVGAGYTITETEADATVGTATSASETTSNDANMRLGLEIKGEKFAFDVMWDSDPADPILSVPTGGIGSPESREQADNDRIIFGATLQM
jgi:hypothetical protein